MLTQLLSAVVFSVALLMTSFSPADKTSADCCQANPAYCVEGDACCAASIKTDCCQADQACCGESTACCATSIKTDC
jgi:hypothetical protein